MTEIAVLRFVLTRLSIASDEILATLYDSAHDPSDVVDSSRQLAGRLDSLFESLPLESRELQKIWTAPENIHGEARNTQTSSQGKFSLELVVDTAHILLEYTVRQLSALMGYFSF